MSIVANEGRDVLVSYNYMLRVEGMYDLPCKSVHSFTKENEFEYVQEGGLNDYVHMLRKPISKPFSFTVERYVGTDPYPVLPMGAELILPVILMVSSSPDQFDKAKRTFVFTGCTVMSKTYGELNAEKSGILTETIVIGYREMMEVTVPVHFGKDGKLWAFDKNGNYLGNNKLSQKESPVTNTVSEKRRWLAKDGEQSQTSAKKRESGTNAVKSMQPQRYWIKNTLFPKGYKEERTNAPRVQKQSAQTRASVIGDVKIEEKATRLWKFDKDNEAGTGKASHKFTEVTAPAQRRWSEGQSSAKQYSPKQNEDTVVTPITQRRWKFDDDEVEGNSNRSSKSGPNSKAQSRKWKIDKTPAGTGEQSAAQAPNSKPKIRKWMIDKQSPAGTGERSAKTRHSATQQDDPKVQAQRYWIKNTLFPKGYTEEKTNVPRIQKQSAKTRYMATQQDDPKAQNQRYWIKNTLFPKGYTEEKTNVPRIQKQSAKTRAAVIGKVKEEDKATRLWKIDQNSAAGTGKASHKFRVATAPAQRRWSEGQSSAKKNESTKVTPIAQRRWEFDNTAVEGNANRSSKFGPNSKAQARKWKIDKQTPAGTGEQSAVQAPDSKPKGRKWVIAKGKGKGEKSAVNSPNTTSKKRKWEMTSNVDGKGSKSANKGPDSTPEQRSWPRVSSARQYEESGKGIPSRKWPEVSSARQYEG